jgi:hemoglobin-like flavoprotein
VTPHELELVAADGDSVRTCPDEFARSFYATLFELAPATRELFPDDLTAQRGKLVNELLFLTDAATDREGLGLDGFLTRARDLGRRHAGYGVANRDYAPVGVALVAALRTCVPEWDDDHVAAWTKLYRLIADVMREGAEDAAFVAG